MKKARNVFIKTLPYLCLVGVIVLGFMTIIGTGGGGGDGDGVVIDNSEFYGDYAVSITIDSCEVGAGIITIGGDEGRKNEDNYLYLPQNKNSTTYTKIDDDGDECTITVTVSGDTVTWDEVCPDDEFHADFVFSNNNNNFTINGEVIEDSPDECEGTVTGSAVKVGSVGVSIGYCYLQYRTSNTFNGYRGWIELTKDGIPVEGSDVKKIELKDSKGDTVDITVSDLYHFSSYSGRWNSSTSSVDFSGPFKSTGFSIRFPEGFELPAGDYTYEVTTSEDDIVSKAINYPGKKELPFVDSATMSSEWLVDNSLRLSWVNPAPPVDYDQLRIYIFDQTAGDVLHIRLPTDMNELTIPSEWVQIIDYYYELTTVYWQVQTRSHTAEKMNYARGLSDSVVISD